MTLQNCFENRRWAESMLRDVEISLKVKYTSAEVDELWYLKNWIEKFDRIANSFTCYPEHHVVYQNGFAELKKLSLSL